MTDFVESDEQEAKEAEQGDFERLLKNTEEQLMLGPKGLPSDADESLGKWKRIAHYVSIGAESVHSLLPEILPLIWCRIHLSVVNMVQESPNYLLIHYSFENLSDEVLPVNLSDSLFGERPRIWRMWATEDLTTGEKRHKDDFNGMLEGVYAHYRIREKITENLLLPRYGIATVTRRGKFHNERGVWYVDGFGTRVPDRTYKFQLLYGGLPSNVFIWTAPKPG